MKKTLYQKYFKRLLDILLSLTGIIILSWLFVVISILIRIKIGNPIFFVQIRPGIVDSDSKEKLFKMYKFRTMNDDRNSDGTMKSDEERMTNFGYKLRSLSLDEIPEIVNILKGDMSFVGPRPQLVNDLVFMSDEERKRHSVKPGLTGLAQINGRNGISWEDKFKYDLKYINNISFFQDVRIFILTFKKVLTRDSITSDNMVTSEDYGIYLLRKGVIDKSLFLRKQQEAEALIKKYYK